MTISGFVNKWVFQFAHVGWGALGMLNLSLYLGPLKAAFIMTALTSGKEFIFDRLTRTEEPCGNTQPDYVDFLFWILGMALGYVFYMAFVLFLTAVLFD